jgi:hypothetical protein
VFVLPSFNTVSELLTAPHKVDFHVTIGIPEYFTTESFVRTTTFVNLELFCTRIFSVEDKYVSRFDEEI